MEPKYTFVYIVYGKLLVIPKNICVVYLGNQKWVYYDARVT